MAPVAASAAEVVRSMLLPVPVEAALVLAVPVRRRGCAGMSRPAAGYIGYTWYHLPDGDLPVKIPAMEAIFAARIARSSLPIREELK